MSKCFFILIIVIFIENISSINSFIFADSPELILGQLVDPVQLRGVEDVHLEGDFVYLPCREGKRLTICSIQDPKKPEILSSFTHDNLNQAAGFDLHGDYAYLASQVNQNILILNVEDKTNPKLVKSIPLGQTGDGYVYKVVFHEGYCYVAHLSDKKIIVVDVKDPQQPQVIHSVTVTTEKDGPFSLLIHKEFLYSGTIFGPKNRLAVLNIKKPALPFLIKEKYDPDIGHLSGQIDGKYFVSVNLG